MSKTNFFDLDDFLLEATLLHPRLVPHYKAYVNCQKAIKWDHIRGVVAMVITFILLIISFFSPGFLISMTLFFVVGSMEFLNARVELLWKTRFSDQILDYLSAKDIKEINERLSLREEIFERSLNEDAKKDAKS